MTLSLTLTPSLVEILHPLPAGTIVLTWDNAVGTIETCSLSVASVVFYDRALGRGPWLYERWQVQPATPADAFEYARRCCFALVEAS